MSSSPSNPNRLRLILAAVVFVMILGAVGVMLLRGDRPWQAAIRAEEGETLERPTGFHLIVEGRLGAFSDGRPVRCSSAGPDQRPLCVIRIRREYVAFAPIGSDEVIQEWRS